MTWPVVKLSELCRVKHGYAFKSRYFESDGPYVLLTPGSFNEKGGYRDQGEKKKFYTGDVPGGFILDEGDLLVAMTEQAPGLLGSSAWIPESNRLLHNQRLGRVVDIDERRLDKRFLYYLFNTREVRHQISASATGTKVRHTAPERIGQVVVSLPPRKMQTRIADELFAYDDLIENNRRRIALLGEAARQLYREWFVRLRFPGREHTAVANGVPEGWERGTLGNVAENFDRLRHPLSVFERENRQGAYPYHGAAGILGYIDGFLFDGRFLLVGEDGTVQTPAGSPMMQLVEGKFWVSNHAHVLSSGIVSIEFLYCLLSFYPIGGHITGVAQPKLTQANLNRIPVVVSTKALRAAFQDVVAPLLALCFVLQNQSQKLKAARDLLLPRLMSGEIAV